MASASSFSAPATFIVRLPLVVTNPVTFEVTAKQENGLIGVQGSIPVVFNDYGIANPSNGGVQTEDNGVVEFVLVFEPAS